jgi:hypothetical protein
VIRIGRVKELEIPKNNRVELQIPPRPTLDYTQGGGITNPTQPEFDYTQWGISRSAKGISQLEIGKDNRSFLQIPPNQTLIIM